MACSPVRTRNAVQSPDILTENKEKSSPPKSSPPKSRRTPRSPFSPIDPNTPRRPLFDRNSHNPIKKALSFGHAPAKPTPNAWSSPKTLAQQEAESRVTQAQAADHAFLNSLTESEDDPDFFLQTHTDTVFRKLPRSTNPQDDLKKISFLKAFAAQGLRTRKVYAIDDSLYIEIPRNTQNPSQFLATASDEQIQNFHSQIAQAFALDALLDTTQVLNGDFDSHYLVLPDGTPLRTKVDLPANNKPYDLSELFNPTHPAFQSLNLYDIAEQIEKFPNLPFAPKKRLAEFHYLKTRTFRWLRNELTLESAHSIFGHMYTLLNIGLLKRIPKSFEIRANGTITQSFDCALAIVDQYITDQGGNPDAWYDFWQNMVANPTSEHAQAVMAYLHEDITSDYTHGFPEGIDTAQYLAGIFAEQLGGRDVFITTMHIRRALTQIVMRFCNFATNGQSTHDEGFAILNRTTHNYLIRRAETETLSPSKSPGGTVYENLEGHGIHLKRPYSSMSIKPVVAKAITLMSYHNIDPERIFGLWFLVLKTFEGANKKHRHQQEVLAMLHSKSGYVLGDI